jgi:glucans biosynthesis protein C
MAERRYDIDWLRCGIIFLLFPFHAARVFDVWEPNYVKSATTSFPLTLVVFFIGFWFMALMFLIAGFSAFYALKSRNASQFIRERVSRLLLPFAFGLVAIVPPQGYMAKLAQGYDGGYLRYLAGYFADFSDISGYFGSFTPAHLWFILFLFVLSLAGLPLFLALRKSPPLADPVAKPVVLLLLFLPLTLLEALPAIGGKNPFFYFFLMILGFLVARDERVGKAIDGLKFPALLALPLAIAAYTAMTFGGGTEAFARFSWHEIFRALARNLSLWLAIIALMGYGAKYLNRRSAALDYLNRAAFPVYILHQSVMMVLAYFVLKTKASIGTEYALIMLGSLAATFAIYELLVRRIGFMRILLGVK